MLECESVFGPFPLGEPVKEVDRRAPDGVVTGRASGKAFGRVKAGRALEGAFDGVVAGRTVGSDFTSSPASERWSKLRGVSDPGRYGGWITA